MDPEIRTPVRGAGAGRLRVPISSDEGSDPRQLRHTVAVREEITPLADIPGSIIRRIPGFSGPALAFQTAAAEPTDRFLRIHRPFSVQFHCNSRVQVYFGRKVGAVIPACTTVEIIQADNESVLVLEQLDLISSVRNVEMLAAGVYAPGVNEGPFITPPDMCGARESYQVLTYGGLIAGATAFLEFLPVPAPAGLPFAFGPVTTLVAGAGPFVAAVLSRTPGPSGNEQRFPWTQPRLVINNAAGGPITVLDARIYFGIPGSSCECCGVFPGVGAMFNVWTDGRVAFSSTL